MRTFKVRFKRRPMGPRGGATYSRSCYECSDCRGWFSRLHLAELHKCKAA